MGHNSSYTKEELHQQPSGCGKPVAGSTVNCGSLQPDGEAWLCPDCRREFNDNLRQLRAKD